MTKYKVLELYARLYCLFFAAAVLRGFVFF